MKIYIDDHIDGFDLEAALQQISEQRREQALRFKFERGRRECVLAYLLLKKGLHELYGITENPLFEYGEHGKPSIVGHPEIHFSLSHCREAVVCVVSDRPVGIDVESVVRYKEGLVAYTMNEQERQQIATAQQPDVAFTRLWTMKEARLKLTGEGITDDLKEALADSGRWHFSTVECLERGYIYTVCLFKGKGESEK